MCDNADWIEVAYSKTYLLIFVLVVIKPLIFFKLMNKLNTFHIYISDFKEPYPARTAYQVAKLPLVSGVLFYE